MAHVMVTINARQFRMACDDGQEEHLLKLAAEVDGKVEQLKGAFGEIGDNRLTVMAAIMIADELEEQRRKLRALEAELHMAKEARALAEARSEAREAAIAAAIEQAAGTVEKIATGLTASMKARA